MYFPYREIIISLALLIVPFLPATNLFFRVGFVLAERVLYLPSIGYCVILGLALSALNTSTHKVGTISLAISLTKFTQNFVTTLCVSVIMMTYSCKTLHRNAEWSNTESLAVSALYTNPSNAKVYFTMANVLAEQVS